jgi:rhamnosyltransferase
MKKTAIVIVTYYPDPVLLKDLIRSCSYEVTRIIIVDNTPGRSPHLELFKYANIIYLGSNKGIAYAQNIGIRAAMESGAEYILLSDQDTVYPDHYIINMVSVFDLHEESGLKIAAAVPLFKDINQEKKKNQGFIIKGKIGFKKIFPEKGYHEIFQAIASGTILNVKYLDSIGLMDEDLFIDWVDIEWCWRAVSKGCKIIGNADVVIMHRLGDSALNIGFREVNLRNAVRHYYITRNAFYLSLHSNNLDMMHRITLLVKSMRYLIGFPVLSRPRFQNLKYVMLGLWHAITNRMGQLKE